MYIRSSRGVLSFGCSAVITVVLLLQVQEFRPSEKKGVDVRDYGVRGDGVTDDTAALQRAFKAGGVNGATVYLPCGTYLIRAGLEVNTNHAAIHGSGDCTILKVDGGNSFVALTITGRGLGPTAKLVQDTTSNTFTAAKEALARLGIVAGSYVLISDQNIASNGPGSPLMSTQQVAKVKSLSGDTATIEGSFGHDFTLMSPHPQNQGCCPYVQKIIDPVSNVSVTGLRIDGASNTGAESEALEANFAVDSEIGFVGVTNFASPTGRVNGIRADTGYHNRFHDITCTACGNGGGVSFWMFRQSLDTIENITVTNSSAQSEAFGLTVSQLNNSTISNVTVDAGGAKGRPFKLARSNHNIFNHVTAKNGRGAMNGISITDISTYNTFHDCAVLNNVQTGIMMFGNFNQHNTFDGCTSEYNSLAQFGQGKDAFGNYGDDFTTINSGNYCCGLQKGGTVIWIRSNHFRIANATISNDTGLASQGLVIFGTQAIVKNNRFQGFKAGKDVQIRESLTP
jgi:hypothetical protein